MYIEKRYIKKIARVFEALSISLRLVDASGACLVPEDGESAALPAGVLAQGLNHHAGRFFYRVLDVHPPLYLVAPEGAPGVEDVLCVADAMIMSLLKSSLSIARSSDVNRRALKQELSGADLISRASEHQIPLEMDRCVVLFQIEQTERSSAFSLLGELVPLSDTDVLVEMNRHLVALIKDMNGIDGMDNLFQFAHPCAADGMIAHRVDDLLVLDLQNLPDIFRTGKPMPDWRLCEQVIVQNYSRLFHPLQLFILRHIFADIVKDCRNIGFVLILPIPFCQKHCLFGHIQRVFKAFWL